MELCWDNIEGIILSKKGNFRDILKKQTYHYHESCKTCGEEFFGKKNGEFCCKNCRTHSNETKKMFSKLRKSLWKDENSIYRTDKYIELQSKSHKNIRNDPNSVFNSKEYREKLSNSLKGKNWKGGYKQKGIPTYDTYAHQIEWCEEVRRNKEDPNILEVKCFKCDEWFVPKLNNIRNRIQTFNGNYPGESHFYCSEQCKNSCSIYGKSPEILMKEDAIRAGRLPWIELTREVQPELRQMVLERDDHKCIKCGETNNLQCHHIYPVNIEPLLSADTDNCITLCVECHKEVHQKDGCRYNQLHMKMC